MYRTTAYKKNGERADTSVCRIGPGMLALNGDFVVNGMSVKQMQKDASTISDLTKRIDELGTTKFVEIIRLRANSEDRA